MARPAPKAAAIPKGNGKWSAVIYKTKELPRKKGEKKRPHPIVAWEKLVNACCAARFATPAEGPVTLECIFVFPRIGKLKSTGRTAKTTKPDCDNLIKPVKDSMEKIVFDGDQQVVREVSEKWYAAINEHPHVEITVVQDSDWDLITKPF